MFSGELWGWGWGQNGMACLGLENGRWEEGEFNDEQTVSMRIQTIKPYVSLCLSLPVCCIFYLFVDLWGVAVQDRSLCPECLIGMFSSHVDHDER